MSRPFDPLWERLLRGGVGRGHARRYLAELQDHLHDLIAEEQQAISTPREAESRALARLGSTEVLAGAMISHRQFRAWGAKAPLAIYLIAPSLALVVSTALALATLVTACAWLRTVGGVPSDLPPWAKPLTSGVVFFTNAMLSILLGWALGIMAVRQRSPACWPLFGIVVLAAVGAAVQVGVTLPSASRHGEIEFLPGFGPSFSQWAQYTNHFAMNLVLTLAPYVGLNQWRAAQANLSDADV